MLKRLCLGALTLIVTLGLLTACENQPTKTNTPANTPRPGPLASINKSPNDDREYLALLLPNHLQVVLVSDPSIEVAAVSMGVGVGSYQDPDTQLGLAHYLEHMLFLGTEKYPEPNSFQKFVDENAGIWNAYTAVDHTNYFFQLNAEQLDQALDYFSDYFKKPTFDPQYSDKERNAVNSEWSMGRSQDNWILYRLSGITANPQHPAQRLTVGNLETLSDKPDSKLHDELLAFYDRYYSANIMRLTIVAKQPLSELQALAEKHFASIANKNIDRPEVVLPGITPNEKGKVIHYRSLRELKQLMIEFPIADNTNQWPVKPNAFINNLITSEEPGTLGEQLRREGLVNTLYGYIDPDSYGQDGVLRVVAELTDKGLQNRDQIIAATFGYLELIKREGVDESYYRELKAMLQKDFENLAKPQPLQAAMGITRAQFDYPVDHLLDADFVYTQFDKKAIEAVLAQLRPENARIWHISNREEVSQPIPFYEGSYSIRSIAKDELTRWQSLATNMAFSLPPENPLFSQQQGEIVESRYTKPHSVISEAGVEAWLTHAQHYREDKGLIELQVNTDQGLASIENLVLATLLNEAFNLQNTTLVDRAGRAGIHISLGMTPERSPMFTISGYAGQHQTLLNELLDAFVNFHISEQEFAQVQDRYLLNLANAKKAPPYQQMFGHRGRLIQQANWPDEEILPVARQVKREQLIAYHQQLFGNNLIRLYAFGNYTEAQIRELALAAKTKMQSQGQPGNRYLLPFITPRNNTRLAHTESIEQTDSALLDAWIATEQSLQTQAALVVLNGILGNELFTQLRTNEQMGYVVGSAPASFNDYPMYMMFVQSTNTDLVGIKSRLDRFRQEFLALLQASTPETIEQIKRSEIANILQKPANFDAEARDYLHEFRVAQYDFDRKQRIIQALESVSKATLLDVYTRLILEQAEGRMTIQLRGTHFADKPFVELK